MENDNDQGHGAGPPYGQVSFKSLPVYIFGH
jgi:hypothetical protein